MGRPRLGCWVGDHNSMIAVMPVGGGVHRLQRGVGDEAVIVIGFHRLGGVGESVVDIADIDIGLVREGLGDLLRPRRALRELESLEASLSSQSTSSFALAWNAAQVFLAMMATPGITSVGMPVALHHKGVDHAGKLLDLIQIGGFDLAAHRRAFGEIRIDHVRQLHIDAEQGLAGDDLGIVHAVMAPAEQPDIRCGS